MVQTETTRQALHKSGIWPKPVEVIPPGVDERWLNADPQKTAAARISWGFDPGDTILLFFGSPAELRGLHTFLEAFAIARRENHRLKLVILSRQQAHEITHDETPVKDLLQAPQIAPHVKVISGYLPPDELVNKVAAADIIALPFELLPSTRR